MKKVEEVLIRKAKVKDLPMLVELDHSLIVYHAKFDSFLELRSDAKQATAKVS